MACIAVIEISGCEIEYSIEYRDEFAGICIRQQTLIHALRTRAGLVGYSAAYMRSKVQLDVM